MLDLECPNCGRMGTVPSDKVNSRLVCKKCHMVFHVSPTGRAMKGEPPPPGKEKSDKDHKKKPKTDAYGHVIGTATKERDWAEGIFDFNKNQLMAGGAVLGVLLLALFYVMVGGKKDDLAIKSQDLANALSAGDLSSVKRFAWSEGADAVPSWYDAIHAMIVALGKESAGHEVLSSVFVLEQNHVKQQGQAIISYAPAAGSTRDQTIAKEAGTTTSTQDQAMKQVLTIWVLDRGSWKLDGKKTAALAPAAPPTAPTTKAIPFRKR